MAEVKWIKITTDVFDDEKILLIESMPSADSIITIWFKLLILAGKQNNNGVFMMSNKLPFTLIFDGLTIKFFHCKVFQQIINERSINCRFSLLQNV